MRVILLIMIGLSILNAEFLRDDINGVVLDTQTKLMWQDYDPDAQTIEWEGAMEVCEDSTRASYTDWRLPNINELRSIVDRSKKNPAIVDGFIYTKSEWYWSSTTTEGDDDLVWHISFEDGTVKDYEKAYNEEDDYFMCVRDDGKHEPINPN
ncbi:MAG: DUF1566 domain-containing protein [Sulfurimonas sp.]|nr:DUF1566 domain-containing protein [Sulfurimonas sp.]